jgi:cytochrome P450
VPVVLDEKYIQDRQTMHRWLLSQSPICEATMPDGQRVWLVTRYDDARAALTHPALRSPVRRQEPVPPSDDARIVADLLDALASREEADLLADFAQPLAVAVLGAASVMADLLTHMIGNSVVDLLANPEQLALLTEDPALLASMVDELLRHESPAAITAPRVATEPVEIGGVEIPAGESVVVVLGAANRDPRRFTTPDAVDVKRGAEGHVAFGHGTCPGADVARTVGQAAIGGLLRRFPHLRLTDAELAWLDSVPVNGYREIPVTGLSSA